MIQRKVIVYLRVSNIDQDKNETPVLKLAGITLTF